MKSTAKTLALGAALLCLLAGGMALPASAAVPLTGTAVSLPWNSDNSVPAESIEAGTYSSNMLLGETQQLSPTVRPRNSTDSVIYLTDDSSVLTVSNSGVVQAVGVGTATVTAAAGNQICAYTISVSMDSTMIVTEMDLALSSNTIYVGNSVSASLQVRPSSASQYATISLTSSNEKVATVNSFGRVTGVSPGTATITAACGSVTASTTVTVLAIPTDTTGTVSSGTTSANSGQVITVTPSCGAQAGCHPHPVGQGHPGFGLPELHLQVRQQQCGHREPQRRDHRRGHRLHLHYGFQRQSHGAGHCHREPLCFRFLGQRQQQRR